MKEQFKIDLVVPYVDATDDNWIKVFLREKKKLKNDKSESTAVNRFRSMGDFFRYFFRCIDKNMPWINNVFLLVQSWTQVPKWLNTEKVKIITHDQFIPTQFLPTFNSGEIEMFLHNIPGLSEHFIYTNDDIFALRAMSETDFFNGDKCVFNYLKDSNSTKNEWRQMCQNNHDVIFNTDKALPYLRLDHEFRPYLKSEMANCYKEHEKQILNSISMFRAPKNLTVFLYSLDLINKGLQQNTKLKIRYACSTSSTPDLTRKLEEGDSICLNDTSNYSNLYQRQCVLSYFSEHYSNKSKYELTDYNWEGPRKSKHLESLENAALPSLNDSLFW